MRGVRLLSHIGGNVWYATLSEIVALLFMDPRITAKYSTLGLIRWVGEILPNDKIRPFIKTKGLGSWAINPDGTIKVSIDFFHNKVKDMVTLNTLIYLGESDKVNKRIANHEKYNDWLKHVRSGNELCYSFGTVGLTDRSRADAAMIFRHKPPENDEYKDSFPFDKTTMSLSGKTALLNTNFTVERTED